MQLKCKSCSSKNTYRYDPHHVQAGMIGICIDCGEEINKGKPKMTNKEDIGNLTIPNGGEPFEVFRHTLSYTFPAPLGDIRGGSDMEILFKAIKGLCEIIATQK